MKEDNPSVHKAKVIRRFYERCRIKTLKWSAKSININNTEYVCQMISKFVYDGPQFANKKDLEKSINDTLFIWNSFRRQQIIDIYKGILSKLIKIGRTNGNLCKLCNVV